LKKILALLFIVYSAILFAQDSPFKHPSEGFEKYNGEYQIVAPTVSKYTTVVFDTNKMTISNTKLSNTYSWVVNNYFGLDYFFVKNNMYLVRWKNDILILTPVTTDNALQIVYLKKLSPR